MGRRKKKNQETIELEIESIGLEGVAVARKEGMVYFVEGAVPGDIVEASVLRKKKNYTQARAEKIIEASDLRIEPLCRHFDDCGGCRWQNLSYPEQLKWKNKNVVDAFERIGKVPVSGFLEIMTSPEVFHYRNKMDFSFGASRWMTKEEIRNDIRIENKHFALGLHIPGRFDKVLDVQRCLIQPEAGNKILNEIRRKALELGCEAYHERAHLGFLRSLILRYSLANDETMMILVTASPESMADHTFLRWLELGFREKFQEVSTAIHAVNDRISPVAVDSERVLYGIGYITEEILGIAYRISPFSFFQTNSYQLDNFIGKIIENGELNGSEIAWDLYCGTGSITLPAAKRAKEIHGIEMVESSIDDARDNARRNGIGNAAFYCADLHSKETPELLSKLPKPDVIFIDPPRAGMHKNLVGHVIEAAPKRIVYVSCNPATQARDCAILAEKYEVESVQPVDMFPHTYHIESIAKLKRK